MYVCMYVCMYVRTWIDSEFSFARLPVFIVNVVDIFSRFKMLQIRLISNVGLMEFVYFRFRRTNKMDYVMRGLMGQCPLSPRIFGLEPPLRWTTHCATSG